MDSSESAKEIFKTKETWYDDKVGDINIYYYWVRAFNSAGLGPFSKGDSGHRQRMTLSLEIDGYDNVGGNVTGPGINCGGDQLFPQYQVRNLRDTDGNP